MNRLISTVAALACVSASAQEIGTEIPPEQAQEQTTTPPPAPTTYDNPYGQPAQAPATTAGATGEGAAAQEGAAADGSAVPGPRKGAFGVRAGFGGSTVPVAPSASTDETPAVPTLGIKFMTSEGMGINVDVGFGLGIGSRFSYGFGLTVGVDAYLGSAAKPIRPFVTGSVGFGKRLSGRSDDFALPIAAGGGAEYWFSDHFSLNGRLLFGADLDLKSMNVISMATFQPGLGATFYF